MGRGCVCLAVWTWTLVAKTAAFSPLSLFPPPRARMHTASRATAADMELQSIAVEELKEEIARVVPAGAFTPKSDDSRVRQLVAMLECGAAKPGSIVSLPQDWESIDGTWQLLYSSNDFTVAGGGALIDGSSSTTSFANVTQEIDHAEGRFSNVVSLSPWPAGLLEDSSVTLWLDHDLKVLSESTPARLSIELSRVRRRFTRPTGGLAAPFVSAVPESSDYNVPRTGFSGGRGEFDVTFIGSGIRITRSTSILKELRIFEKIE